MTVSLRTIAGNLLCTAVLIAHAGTSALAAQAASSSDSGQEDQGGRAQNVQFEVQEGRTVRILYDLAADDPGVLLGVRLLVSLDGGKTFNVVPTIVSGDVGPAVAPGTGKQIRWEASRDIERLDVEQLRVRLVVSAIMAPRPQSTWGLSVSAIPDWRIPSGFEHVLFSLNTTAYQLSGSEVRLGLVRGRVDASDWGFELVWKRAKPGTFVSRSLPIAGLTQTTTYATDGLWMAGAEVYKFFSLLKVGERQHVGLVVAAGASMQPGGSVERRIEGPVFESDPYQTSTPRVVPVGPGVMVDDHGGIVPVLPGEREVRDRVTATRLFDKSIWSTDPQVIGRVELAWAITLSPRTRLRVSGGLNFPAFQIIGVDLVRFFR